MVALIENNEINILPHPKGLFLQVAEDFIRRAREAVNAKDEFTVVLSGGCTPKQLFITLAHLSETEYSNNKIPWGKIKFFFGDERYVAPDNKESNYHTAHEYLFSKVPILAENIYRIPTKFSDPDHAAENYEKTLRSIFHLQDNEYPKFDLIYLGLGEDGHTASLMPNTDLVMNYWRGGSIRDTYRLVAALWVPKQKMYRVTLTPPAINNAINVAFLVVGENKAMAVREVLEGPLMPQEYPAQLILCLNNKNIWYLDQTAASQLSISKNK
jgi:6-phosphogluconolactonase